VRRAQSEQVVRVGTAAIHPMVEVVDVQPTHPVAARHTTATIAMLDDRAESG